MLSKKNISNWGNYPSVETEELVTTDNIKLKEFIISSETLIARGNGRSYGDASLSKRVFSTLTRNKIRSFDEDLGIIDCESGVLLSDILAQIIPKGWFLEATPGTKFITVGGAVAANVHGKNHHQQGCFGESILSLEIMTEIGESYSCSAKENSALFYQTIGGMGLTGIILGAKFKLQRITSTSIKYKNAVANNLSELMDLFEKNKNTPYSVAWIDCLAKGPSKGRGIFMSGKHENSDDVAVNSSIAPLSYRSKSTLNIPFYVPSFVLSALTIKLFNIFYFNKQKSKPTEGLTTINQFFYPLDGIRNWNRIYGRKGFVQYQCVFPLGKSKEGLEEILEAVQGHSLPPFLTVLKLFGKASEKSPWSFPVEGYTLAMDFKFHKGIQELVDKLDAIVQKHGGKVYLAKDALSCKEVAFVPKSRNEKFSSIQSKRLS